MEPVEAERAISQTTVGATVAHDRFCSVHNPSFLTQVEEWLNVQREIFLVIRYSHRGGMRDYVIINTNDAFIDLINVLPPRTEVIVMPQSNLPLRGIADESLLEHMLDSFEAGKPHVLLELDSTDLSGLTHVEIDNQEELISEYADFIGKRVAFGIMPPWHRPEDIGALVARVPLPDGTIQPGLY